MTLESGSAAVRAPGPPVLTDRFAPASNERLLHALAVVALQIVLNGVGFGVIAPFLLRGHGFAFRGTIREFALVLAITALGAGVSVGLAICAFGRVSLRGLGWVREGAGRDVLAGTLAFAPCLLLVLGVAVWAGGGEAARALLGKMASYSFAQHLLFACIGASASFSEESIFRGYLQPVMMKRLGVVAGTVVTAAVFAAYHLQFRPAAWTGKFALGLVLGAVRALRPTLYAPATAHALVWLVIGPA